jgi:hypothetical protein
MPGITNDLNITQLGIQSFNNVNGVFTGVTITGGTGITVTNGNGQTGNPTIALTAGPTGAIEHLTGDTGGQLNPDVNNNFNLQGQQAGTIPVMDTIGASSTIKFEDRTWTTALVVDPSSTVGLRGTFTTITLAMAAAVSGQTIFVRAGTYSESFSLKAGVNITGFPSDGDSGDIRFSSGSYAVQINGQISFTLAGFACISNIFINNSGGTAISVSGSNSTLLLFKNCYIYGNGHTPIVTSGSNSEIDFENCSGDLSTTGIAYFTSTGGANLTFNGGTWANSGSSLTASTWSAGNISMMNIEWDHFLSVTSTGGFTFLNCFFNISALNTTNLTLAGTSSGSIRNSWLLSGSASSISIGSGTTLTLIDSTIGSTNTNAITGSGTLTYSNVNFNGSSNTINTTTQTGLITRPGIVRSTTQPCFLSHLSANATSVTGDGTTVTIVYDTVDQQQGGTNYASGTGIFTAPFTGWYQFSTNLFLTGLLVTHTEVLCVWTFTGSSISSRFFDNNGGLIRNPSNQLACSGSIITFMSATDTLKVQLTVGGGTKAVSVSGGAGSPQTNFAGFFLG